MGLREETADRLVDPRASERDSVDSFAEPQARDDRRNSRTPKSAAPLAALALAACGGDSGSSGGGAPPPTGGGGGTPTPTPTVAKPQTDAEAARFLLQAGISASTGAIAQLKSEGYAPWLDAQMSAPVAQTGRAWLTARGFDAVNNSNYFNNSTLADWMVWSQLMGGEDGVRRRIALALSEFFVVSTSGIDVAWRSQAMAKYWDILNAHAFGNFRDLLEDVTLNPAMGVWLNTRGNRAADGKGREPDENYAREVMQLFTIGLYELNPDGTEKTSGGAPIETYTNEDVSGLARVFTGYDFDYSRNTRIARTDNPSQSVDSIEYTQLPMTADPSKWQRPRATGYHSGEEKRFLRTVIPAGTGPAASLKTALDTLFDHPNVGPFFGRQMIQRLVTSNPSSAYVARVAAAFADNGKGRRGDLRAVFKAILLDDEARSAAGLTAWNHGKLREPILRLAQWARTFGGTSESGDWKVGNLSDKSSALGQSPLRSPSVFNFFRPGHVPGNSQASNNRMVAPEFQLVDEISIAGYVNFIERVIEGKQGSVRDVQPNYAEELKLAHDADALIDRIALLMTGSQLSPANRSLIRDTLTGTPLTATDSDDKKRLRVHLAVLLVMVSPEYLVQK